jgi:hypothetical protein
MMTRIYLTAAATVLLGLAAAPVPAFSQETGLAGIHAWVPAGRNKTCLATHFHNGSGTGKTRKEAERAAIQNWESFTIWEYGRSWGRFSIAVSKTVKCDRSTTSEFSCQVSARPCILRSAKGKPKAKR